MEVSPEVKVWGSVVVLLVIDQTIIGYHSDIMILVYQRKYISSLTSVVPLNGDLLYVPMYVKRHQL